MHKMNDFSSLSQFFPFPSPSFIPLGPSRWGRSLARLHLRPNHQPDVHPNIGGGGVRAHLEHPLVQGIQPREIYERIYEGRIPVFNMREILEGSAIRGKIKP